MPKAKKTRATTKKNGVTATKKSAKATSRKTAGVGTLKGELPYTHKLRGKLHLRLKAASAEAGQIQAQVELAASKIEAMKKDPTLVKVFIAQQEHRELLSAHKRKREEYMAIQLECAGKLEIPPDKIHEYTFDTENGVVMYNGPAPKT